MKKTLKLKSQGLFAEYSEFRPECDP
jgi:hypothetical protein